MIGKSLAHGLQIFAAVRQINFVRHDAPGSFRKSRIIQVDLAPQTLQILDRVTSFASRDVEDEKQKPAARDVPKKIVTETDVPMRSFDQAGNIRDRRAAIVIEMRPLPRSDEA